MERLRVQDLQAEVPCAIVSLGVGPGLWGLEGSDPWLCLAHRGSHAG